MPPAKCDLEEQALIRKSRLYAVAGITLPFKGRAWVGMGYHAYPANTKAQRVPLPLFGTPPQHR